MADKPMDLYLNDHLGGAMLGSNLAEQIRDRAEGAPLGQVMTGIATAVEEDREALVDLMERLDVSSNPIKQATGWMAEKASRVKFSGAIPGEPDYGLFMALETLRLGVAGKKCLWLTLKEVRDEYSELAVVDLDRLIERAASQESVLEEQRMNAGMRALGKGNG
jgi:hypothetical protein